MVRQRKNRARTAKTLDDDLAALPELPLDDLKRRWEELYGNPPPPKIGRALLTRAVAYRLQEQTFDGLNSTVRKRLARMAADLRHGRNPSKTSPTIKPGTRLIREWQGVTHEVIVLEKGVQYRGRTWDSLSAVAREITGTRWSGPLFFGLKRQSDGRS